MHKRLLLIICALFAALPLHAQTPATEIPLPITLTDASGTEVTITSLERLVSGSGDVTEIIYELGFYDHLVGIDASATYPPQALDEIPSVGFGRALSVEPIAALDPDVFFCTQTCSPESVFEQLRGLGVAVVIIPDSENAGAELPFQKFEMVAAALGVPERGAALAARVEQEIGWVQTALATTTQQPVVLHVYLRGRGLQLAVGDGTPADAMIEMAGGINAAEWVGVVGYQALTPEIILAAYPDFLLLTDGNVEASGGLDEILGFQGINATPAAQEGKIIIMDTAELLGMSTRIGRAALHLATQLHPDITWESTVSYPYTFSDASGTSVTIETAPQILIAGNPDLLALTRRLGFHSQLADAIPADSLIIAAQSDEWGGLRASGARVVVVADDASIEEVAAALNVPGRGVALLAQGE